MHRLLVPPDALRGSTLILTDPGQLHHLRDVLHARVGDAVECLDGQGGGSIGVIVGLTAGRLEVRVERRLEPQPAGPEIWLAASLLKGERFDWLLQKATELGVTRLLPMVTRHTVVKPPARRPRPAAGSGSSRPRPSSAGGGRCRGSIRRSRSRLRWRRRPAPRWR